MASYSLLASNSTVQVLSPTIVNDAVFCTIQTRPSGIIASMTVSQAAFDAGEAGPELTAFADGIEAIVGRGHIVGGSGTQTIDPSGLLADQVAFVVEYVPPGTANTSITADALVPVGLLSQSDPAIAEVVLGEAEAIIAKVYNNLKNAASG